MKCPLCLNDKKFHKLFEVNPANFSKRITSFDIFRCGVCDLAIMDPWPAPEDIAEIYIDNNAWAGVRFDERKKKNHEQFLENLYQKYGYNYNFSAKTCLKLSSKKNPKILDLGCSSGLVMKAFYDQNPGLDITGVDISQKAKDEAFPEIKEKIIIGDFLKLNFETKFDIVTLNFVVEHLPNFLDFFKKAISLLNDDGILFFSTPDIDSAKARTQKDKWFLINRSDAKMGHILWFNDKSIRYLSDHLNLKIVHKKNRGELFDYIPSEGQKVLKKIFGTDPSGRRFIRNFSLRIAYATVVDGLISERVGYGDSSYVFLQKK